MAVEGLVTLGKVFGVVISCATICAFVYRSAKTVEDHWDETKKRQFAQKISGADFTSLPRKVSEIFLGMFDGFFKTKQRRWLWLVPLPTPSFLRSIFATLITLVALGIIWFLTLPEGYSVRLDNTFDKGGWYIVVADSLNRSRFGFPVSLFFIYAGVVNFIGDYVSLTESRFVIGRMVDRSFLVIGELLFIDFLLTLLIIFVVVTPIGMVVLGDISLVAAIVRTEVIWVGFLAETVAWVGFDQLGELLRPEGRSYHPGHSVVSIFVLSTFITSVWVWLYLLAGYVLRFAFGLVALLQRVFRSLNPKEKPLTALAITSNIVISIVFLGILIAILIPPETT